MTQTTGPELGRMEKVDLRAAWESEAGAFTPWLAEEHNLALLADAIGVELELESTEKDVGPFRADILCKDTVDDTWVLIENQLERTDHIHLGQLLTYAAGLKAVTIVWIAARFTDEHRAALDWLNEITDERFNFFGLEVELWRIGDSPIAPKFNLACEPNEWTKPHRPSAANLTETRVQQQDYWKQLREFLLDRDGDVKPRKARPQNWATFAVGRSGFVLKASVHTQKKFVKVLLGCRGKHAEAHFNLLKQDRENIEKELGEELRWVELPKHQASRIELRLQDADPTDESDWPRQHKWLADKLEAFHEVFAERVKALDHEDYGGVDAHGPE